MGVFDFLFGKPEQTGQLDPETKAARDFMLDQMLMQYSAGPVNVPTYQAVAPSAMYSGTNSLLSSLGLEGVAPPSMPTTNIGGMDVYTSQPFQTQMETAYAEQYPGQYDYLRSFYMDPVTGDFGERSYGFADPMAVAAAQQAIYDGDGPDGVGPPDDPTGIGDGGDFGGVGDSFGGGHGGIGGTGVGNTGGGFGDSADPGMGQGIYAKGGLVKASNRYAGGGYVTGPGTGTSDSIPATVYQNGRPVERAAISDGEFVMTERAVKNAGDGDRRKGAARMYQMMQQLERGGLFGRGM